MDALPHGLLVLDGQLSVRRSNPRYCEMLATTPEETVGRRLFELSNGLWDVSGVRALVEGGGHRFRPRQRRARARHVGRRLARPAARARGPAEGSSLRPRALLHLHGGGRCPDATMPGPREATRDRDELIARAAHELRGPFGSMANWAHLLSQGLEGRRAPAARPGRHPPGAQGGDADHRRAVRPGAAPRRQTPPSGRPRRPRPHRRHGPREAHGRPPRKRESSSRSCATCRA